MVRSLFASFAVLAFAAGAPTAARAQSATQVVTFEVRAVNEIAVTGSPNLVITKATAGSAPVSAQSSGSTWAVSTNQTGAKVVGALEAPMPSGLTLSAQLTPPSGATSLGMKPLGTTPVDLVTSISRLNESGLPLTYQLDATPNAGKVASTSRAVTFTITGGA